MKKIYLLLSVLLGIFSNCSQAGSNTELLALIDLFNFRQNVNISGKFFGIYHANVKAIPLSSDGQCNRDGQSSEIGSTDSTGEFQLTYKRFSSSNGNVCILAFPKEVGSRFFAVDQQRELDWVGSEKFQILIVPEPSTTSRSQFNVVSTPFNRMAARRLERLAKGNSDPAKLEEYRKTANRQVVSQFGLSRGLGKSQRISSIEASTPELTDIIPDFTNPKDPMTLRFTIMIGGIQKMAIPTKPDTYNDVVQVVSEYLSSGTGNSVGEDGKPILLPKDKPENKGLCSDCTGSGKPLSEGNSLSKQVSNAVNSFVKEKAADLGIPAETVSSIVSQVVVQDKPAFGPTAPPSTAATPPPPSYTYGGSNFIYTIGSKVSLKSSYSANTVSFFMIKEGANLGLLPNGLEINSETGEISGTPKELGKSNFIVVGSGIGGQKSTPISMEIVPVPTIQVVDSPAICESKDSITICKYGTSGIQIPLQIEGIEEIFPSGKFPSNVVFDFKEKIILGNTTETCKEQCVVTLDGIGKGGTASLTIQFIEVPSFAYPTVAFTYREGSKINIKVLDESKRALDTFSLLNPGELLPGLSFDSKTGEISGTISTTSIESTKLNIIAQGFGGSSGTTELSFVREPTFTLSNGVYAIENNVYGYNYTANESFSIELLSQAAIKRFEISPTPIVTEGVAFENNRISGNIPKIQNGENYSKIYTITAFGLDFNGKPLELKQEIRLIQKPILSYPISFIGSVGKSILLAPEEATGIDTFSLVSLPAGLLVNESLGVVSGAFQADSTPGNNYAIRGTGKGGEVTAKLEFKPKPALAYPPSYTGSINQLVMIRPLTSESIEKIFTENLPSCLQINSNFEIVGNCIETIDGNFDISAIALNGETVTSRIHIKIQNTVYFSLDSGLPEGWSPLNVTAYSRDGRNLGSGFFDEFKFKIANCSEISEPSCIKTGQNSYGVDSIETEVKFYIIAPKTGMLKFNLDVSSEGGYDKCFYNLYHGSGYYTNAQATENRIASGEISGQVKYRIPDSSDNTNVIAGEVYTLVLKYSKDGSVSSGLDRCWAYDFKIE